MVRRNSPPSRGSIEIDSIGTVVPSGPQNRTSCSGSVSALQISSRDASNTRVTVKSCSGGAELPTFSGIFRAFLLNFVEMAAEPVEGAFPELAVTVQPVGRCAESSAIKARRPQLRFPASRDEAGVLEDLDVLGHRLKAQLEGFGELVDRRFAIRQPGQDRPPCRIGQRGERLAQFVDRHLLLTQTVYQPAGGI